MCEENRVGESQVAERQKKRMCERWSVQKRRIAWGKHNMIIRMFAVKRWAFPSDKLFVTVFANKGHFRSD